MKMKEKRIDVTEIWGSTTSLVGRDMGEKFLAKCTSKNLNFERLEKEYDKIIFVIEERVRSMNKSFFLGAFELRIWELGEDGFRNKYGFEARENIKKRITEEFISAAMMNRSQLDIALGKHAGE